MNIKLLGACLGLGVLTACTPQTSHLSSKTVVQVNGVSLNAKEFSNRLAHRLKELDAFSAKDPLIIQSIKEEIIKSFITRTLVLEYCKENKIEVSDALVDKEIASLRSQYPDDLSFRTFLTQSGLSFAEWRNEIHGDLLEKVFFEKLRQKIVPPSEIEIKKHYEENKQQFKRQERIFLRQIFVADENSAQVLLAEAKKGDFIALAKKYSLAPEGPQGGLIGWVEKGSIDFFEPLFSNKTKAQPQLIKSAFGFHIVRMEKKLPAGFMTLDEARVKIVFKMKAQREQGEFISWLDRQIRSSKIYRDDVFLKSLKIETKGAEK